MQPVRCSKLALRINPDDIPGTLAFLDEKWQENIKNLDLKACYLASYHLANYL